MPNVNDWSQSECSYDYNLLQFVGGYQCFGETYHLHLQGRSSTWNTGNHLQDYMVLQSWRQLSTSSLPWEPQIISDKYITIYVFFFIYLVLMVSNNLYILHNSLPIPCSGHLLKYFCKCFAVIMRLILLTVVNKKKSELYKTKWKHFTFNEPTGLF
jgi:hypothetical protein